MAAAAFINDFSIACALGVGRQVVGERLASAHPPRLHETAKLIDGRETTVGRMDIAAENIRGGSRTNELTARLIDDLRPAIDGAIGKYGAARVGMILGTSTTGINEAAHDLKLKLDTGAWLVGFRFEKQELGDTVAFAAAHAGVSGPSYVVSTACTSGSKAMATAARLLETGLADAVICGGVDTLADLTLNGFAALESIAPSVCNPMSVNRCGINIGEGGALFMLSREPAFWRLEGFGESSDAHHASAPDPSAAGAEIAVRKALAASGATTADVGFVHLHGTATRLNDQMEAVLVDRVFGLDMPCASTKPLTGHTLGAAGAVQAGLSLLAMERGVFPPHVWDGMRDPELAPIRLAAPGERPAAGLNRVLSLSFAFGGNNIALMLGRG
ncbi:MAG: beta-ketoacyl synthase N-terminal-like domain-containing protein [Alphaproteobacteria bacterium]